MERESIVWGEGAGELMGGSGMRGRRQGTESYRELRGEAMMSISRDGGWLGRAIVEMHSTSDVRGVGDVKARWSCGFRDAVAAAAVVAVVGVS